MKRFFYLLLFCAFHSLFPQNFDLDNFIKLKSSKIPEWMFEQIRSNFRPFADSGITLKGIEDLYQHLISYPAHPAYRYLRFRVIDGVIYRHVPKNRPVVQDQSGFYQTLMTICRQAGDLPSVDFVMHYNDATPCGPMPDFFWLRKEDGMKPCAPFFAFGKFEDGEDQTIGLIHIPWNYSLMNHNNNIRTYDQVTAKHPWETRINRAIWRGEPSDLRIPEEDFGNYTTQELYNIYKTRHRYRVCELSLQHPDYIDAGFSSNRTYPMLLNPLLAGMFKPRLPEISDHMQFKYLICLDGWGCSNNFWWGLAWGALCIKPEGGMTDWYYSALKPYKHFLPVKKDLSNLIEVIQWAQTHDEECRQIAQNGSSLFHSEMTNDHGLLYFYLVLKEYARLQKFSKEELVKSTLNDSNWVRVD